MGPIYKKIFRIWLLQLLDALTIKVWWKVEAQQKMNNHQQRLNVPLSQPYVHFSLAGVSTLQPPSAASNKSPGTNMLRCSQVDMARILQTRIWSPYYGLKLLWLLRSSIDCQVCIIMNGCHCHLGLCFLLWNKNHHHSSEEPVSLSQCQDLALVC